MLAIERGLATAGQPMAPTFAGTASFNAVVGRDQVSTALQQSALAYNHLVSVVELELQRLQSENQELRAMLEVREAESARVQEEAKQHFVQRAQAELHNQRLSGEVRALRSKVMDLSKRLGENAPALCLSPSPSASSNTSSQSDAPEHTGLQVCNLPATHQRAVQLFLQEARGTVDETAIDDRNVWAISKLDASKVESILFKAAEQIKQKFPNSSKMYNPPAVVYSTLWALVKQENLGYSGTLPMPDIMM